MTLDEAIRRMEIVAEIKEKQIKNGDWEKYSLTERDCIKSAEEHRQLAEWLKDYKRLKEQSNVPDINDGDIISRQAVLDTISELNAISFYEAQEDSKETYYEIRQAIKDLSPVKQEPKTGHWILKIEDWNKWICSKCGHTERTDIHVSLGYDFCPKCGAKMSENPTGSESEVRNETL